MEKLKWNPSFDRFWKFYCWFFSLSSIHFRLHKINVHALNWVDKEFGEHMCGIQSLFDFFKGVEVHCSLSFKCFFFVFLNFSHLRDLRKVINLKYFWQIKNKLLALPRAYAKYNCSFSLERGNSKKIFKLYNAKVYFSPSNRLHRKVQFYAP